MKFYGLKIVEAPKKHKSYIGRTLGFYTESLEGGSPAVGYSLEVSSENVWLTSNLSTAERAMGNSSAWYNAGYETPMISDTYFDKLKKDFEIFEIEI